MYLDEFTSSPPPQSPRFNTQGEGEDEVDSTSEFSWSDGETVDYSAMEAEEVEEVEGMEEEEGEEEREQRYLMKRRENLSRLGLARTGEGEGEGNKFRYFYSPGSGCVEPRRQ